MVSDAGAALKLTSALSHPFHHRGELSQMEDQQAVEVRMGKWVASIGQWQWQQGELGGGGMDSMEF